MRPINQRIMEQVFAVTDAMPMSREALRIPLGMVGEGAVTRGKDGRFEIALPDREDLAPFLAALPERLRALGAEAAPPTPPGA